MSRIIKFREIKIRGKRIDNGEWAYGSYHSVYEENFYINEWKWLENGNRELVKRTFDHPLNRHWILVQTSPTDSGWSIGDTYRAYEVTEKTIGQATGYIDKKLKPIYEGDILEADNGQKYIVEWIDQICGFYLSIPNTHRGKEFISCAASQSNGPITLHTHEVIGNIYAPSLLTPQNTEQ